MSFYRRLGNPLPLGTKPIQSKMFGRNNDLKFSLRLAEIIRVDYENMLCDLAFIQGSTPNAEEVPISAAYWSRRGFLGAMPEVGAIAIVGFTAVHQDSGTQPLILAFLPNGYKTALRFDPFGYAPRDAEELDVTTEVAATELEGYYGVIRRKFRKIYPGTIYGASKEGSELLLDSGIRLYDRGGQEIILRDEDSSSILTSKDFYLTTSAGRTRSGRIVRSGLNLPSDFLNDQGKFPYDNPMFDVLAKSGLIFNDGTPVSDMNTFPSVTLPSGKIASYVTENWEDPNDIFTRFLTEHRTEIQEFSDNRLPFSDSHGFDADVIAENLHYLPFIETVLGTVVGNDPYTSKGRAQYGQILKPVIFTSDNDTTGKPSLEVIENSHSSSDSSLAAAALYRMQRPDGLGELFLSHDKEGHVFLSIPASTSKASNLGAGRSMEADLKGSLKLAIGANKTNNVSVDLDTEGGLTWNLGSARSTNRSLDLVTKGGLGLTVRGSDNEGNAFKGNLHGNVDVLIQGTTGVTVRGDSLEDVTGVKEISSDALSFQVGIGNFDINVLSDQNNTIAGDYELTIGKGKKTTIFKGNEETSLISGNVKTSFTIPSTYEIKYGTVGTHLIEAAGSLTVTRKTSGNGSYSFEANTGTYSVDMGVGSISLVAGLGSMNISTAGIELEGPQINLKGNVGLGAGSSAPNAVIGGIPGPSPHLDYITGLPLLGNPIVRTV